MAKKRRSPRFKHVAGLAGDVLVETIVASVSYAAEIRAQMIEDFDELKGFWQREDHDDEEEEEEDA
jgi:hypothetical protein